MRDDNLLSIVFGYVIPEPFLGSPVLRRGSPTFTSKGDLPSGPTLTTQPTISNQAQVPAGSPTPPSYKYRWLNRWLETLIGRCRTLYHIIGLFTNSRYFDNFILGIVVLNTGTLVAQTFDIVAVRGGWFFSVMDASFLAVYLLEFVLKVSVLRKKFFKNAWNDLDFVIVFMSLIDFILPLIESSGSFSGNASSVFRILRVFKGIRAIRAFRVLRTIR
ncbi:cation channel sperm-associated protein 1-like [Huso huso]|uniref:Cation channel sperm-associated protein 1-like n=1 Tax=Huso huso TaxID=61971 RepID=A0ABR0Y104_HUSHU